MTTSMMPVAFVGYAMDLSRHGRGLMIRCCAWCPDKAELDRWAAAHGTPVTHTCCPECAQRQMAAMLGEPAEMP